MVTQQQTGDILQYGFAQLYLISLVGFIVMHSIHVQNSHTGSMVVQQYQPLVFSNQGVVFLVNTAQLSNFLQNQTVYTCSNSLGDIPILLNT